MFGKKKTQPSSISTLVGPDTTVTGDVSFSGGFHVDGRIVGNVEADADSDAVLSISERGCVEGSVNVPQVELNGTVKGDVIAMDRVKLGPTARVVGNVIYALIEMAIGAEVNGKLVHRPASRPALIPGSLGSASVSVDPVDGSVEPEIGTVEPEIDDTLQVK